MPNHALTKPSKAIKYLLNGKPPEYRFYFSNHLSGIIRDMIPKINFDIIQIDHTRMGLYLDIIPRHLLNRSIWMLHDIDFIKASRSVRFEPKNVRKLRVLFHSYILRLWLPRYAELFNRIITVSNSDKDSLLRINSSLHVDVINNGVDTMKYQPLSNTNTGHTLVFVGDMNSVECADAMIHFCQNILPRIRNVLENIELWIVGVNPGLEVKKLQGNGVHITGRVNDVRPFYHRCKVSVVPLRSGGGTRLKILEAMALGRPVVSTSIGCEGLDVTDGVDILIADDPAQFADKTVCLLTNPDFRFLLAKNARQLVVKKYNWRQIANNLYQVYENMVLKNHKTFSTTPLIHD